MVLVYFAEGFEEVEALSPVDVLRRAELDVRTVAMSDERTVMGAHGVPIVCDMVYADTVDLDVRAMVLPGGMPGSTNLMEYPGFLEKLRAENEKGTTICAICAAPMVLANAGILSGKNATIYPGMEPELGDAKPCDELVCVDGNLITSRGPATAMNYAFGILEELTDAETAQRIKREMLIDW